ncbi:MAG: TlpA disulfide reductase family protein [Myxococcota bacterium]|nr:TlpA disulfide reductase family protein [Myxococcota bacterium]
METSARFVASFLLASTASCATGQPPQTQLIQIAEAQEEGELQSFYLLSEKFVREFPNNSMVDKIRYDWALQLVSENLTTPKSQEAEKARALLRQTFESAKDRQQKFMAGLVLMKFSPNQSALSIAAQLQIEFAGDPNLPQVYYWLIQRSVNQKNVVEAGKYVVSLKENYPQDPYLEQYLPILRRSEMMGRRFPFPKRVASELSEKWVLVDFWATFCEPCIAALPKLKKAQAELPKDKFRVLGVSIDDDEEAFLKFMNAHKMPWPSVRVGSDKSALAASVGVAMIPTYFVVSPDGLIVSTEESATNSLEKIRRELAKANN